MCNEKESIWKGTFYEAENKTKKMPIRIDDESVSFLLLQELYHAVRAHENSKNCAVITFNLQYRIDRHLAERIKSWMKAEDS